MKFKKIIPLFVLLLTGCDSLIPDLNNAHTHSLVHHNAQAATCTQAGTIEYWSCKDCKKRYSDAACTKQVTDITAPALGHHYVHNSKIEATASQTGLEDNYKCDRCNEYFILENGTFTQTTLEELIIPKLTYIDVSFNYSGISFQHILSGGTATEPTIVPTKESTAEYNYTFKEWQLNGEKFDFSTPVYSDITLEPYFTRTPREYTITFVPISGSNIVKTFTCETDPSTFQEPQIPNIPGYVGSWGSYDLSLLQNQISYLSYAEGDDLLAKPVIEKHEGYTIKFHVVDHATKYTIHDDNDFRDSIVLNASDADANGYLYYTTEVVGKHNVSVTASADNYVSRTSDVFKCVENEPVFAYSPFHSVYFYDIRSNPQPLTYSLLMENGSFEYVSQDTFNSTYIKNKGNIVDYTDAQHIDNIMLALKESGSNIVSLSNRFVDVESRSDTWWFTSSFETSTLKRAMDAAYRHNMKCIITDFDLLNKSVSDNTQDQIKGRITSNEFKAAVKHPAFYGIEIEDEPMPGNEIINAGKTVKAILQAWHNDSELSKMPDPFIHTDLCSYNRNKNSDAAADPYLFETPQDYQDYLESWITNTGLNYLCYDYYTYTTYIYGQQSYLGTQYFYDSSKVIMDAVNNLRAKYDGLVVHQTITSSNYSGRKDVTSKDVFASTYLSISQGYYGYSIFTFSPASATQENQPLDYNLNKTDTYTWIKEANKQYKIIKGLLDGYKLKTNTISTYKKTSISESGGIGYGFDVRTSTSTFENDDNEQIKMVVNFNTYWNNTTTSVNVPSGSSYIVFGYQKTIQTVVSSGTNVTLNNGEAILIF